MALKTCATCSASRNEESMITDNDKDFCNQTCFLNYNSAKNNRAYTSNIIKVMSTMTNARLLAANEARKMATIYNNSISSLIVKYGASATIDSFTLKVGGGDYLELPYPCYTGQIDGFWESVDGNAMITEIS